MMFRYNFQYVTNAGTIATRSAAVEAANVEAATKAATETLNKKHKHWTMTSIKEWGK